MHTPQVIHQPEQRHSARHSDSGAAVASPQSKQIARLESLAANAPAHAAQRKLAEMINGSPHQTAQRRGIAKTFGVVQAKTDVKEDLGDRTDSMTSHKRINTPNFGEGWYRFAKNDKVIDSFVTNLSTKTPKGTAPVSATVDIAAQALLDGVGASDIPGKSRPTHFKWGDAENNTDADHRKGKWTWHHKAGPYKMELVDMHAHGGFYHHGGFSGWRDHDDGDSDSI